MLSKKEFAEIIYKLRDADDLHSKIGRLLREYDQGLDPYCGIDIFPSHENIVVNLLRHIFCDADTDCIGYFCWERDFGRASELGDVEIDGTPIPLNSAEDLYDLLVDNITCGRTVRDISFQKTEKA